MVNLPRLASLRRQIRRRALSIVEQVLSWLEKCCEEFCSATGIGKTDVVLEFVEAIVTARLNLLRFGYDVVSEWRARHIIGKFISTRSEQWAHRARERRATADAVLAAWSSIYLRKIEQLEQQMVPTSREKITGRDPVLSSLGCE